MNQRNSLSTAASAAPRFPYTLPGVLVLVALYASVHALTRLFSSGNLGEDDPLDNLIAQTLAPGYNVQHGPLYDWAIWALQHVFGAGLSGFLFLKYALLVVMAGCIFQITRRITQSALWAFIAVESMATVYQIFWRFHEGFTHRVGAMVLAVLTVWAIIRLLDRPSRGNYLLFAALIGLGLLTEHIYAFALFATLATDLSPPLPAYSAKGFAGSLRDAFTFPLLVLAPYIVVLPMVFPAIFRTIFRQSRLRSDNPLVFDPKLFLFHILLIELIGLVLFNGLLYSRSNYAVHVILPMMVIAIPWLTEKARETNPTPRRVQVFMAVLLGFTITAYGVRSGNLFVYEPFCSRCRWAVPFPELADKLREQGFDRGTIIVNDPHVGGNLRRFFPDSRIVMSGLPVPAGDDSKIAVVWPVSDKNADMPADLRNATAAAQVVTPPGIVELPWKHLWKPLGYRTSSWGTAIMERPN